MKSKRPKTGEDATWRIALDGKQIKMLTRAGTINELLGLLNISGQEALVRVDGKIRPEGFPLAGARRIEVVRVVFGG